MKRRLVLIALASSPLMGFADSFSSRSAGDMRRQREIRDQFMENKNAMQQGKVKEKKETEKDKTDTVDREKSTD